MFCVQRDLAVDAFRDLEGEQAVGVAGGGPDALPRVVVGVVLPPVGGDLRTGDRFPGDRVQHEAGDLSALPGAAGNQGEVADPAPEVVGSVVLVSREVLVVAGEDEVVAGSEILGLRDGDRLDLVLEVRGGWQVD